MTTNFEDLILRDTFANRPAAGKPGRLFYDTTNNKMQRDNGSTWDDVEPTIPAGYTDEQAQDAVGGMADANTLVYTDSTPLLEVKKQMSITADGSGLKLVNDETSPGNNQVYGTDGSGVKGWKNDPTGGGGITQSFLGYDTIGGSTENMTVGRAYTKKITVSAAGILSSIDVYCQMQAGQLVGAICTAVYNDNAGTPQNIIHSSNDFTNAVLLEASGGTRNARWLSIPCGLYVPAADYWISVMCARASSMVIYYDGSGSDRYYTSGGQWFADWDFYSPTTSSNKYSIRASIFS